MKARVTQIESARHYKDGQRRITLRFDEAGDVFANQITVPEQACGVGTVDLDQVFEVVLVREQNVVDVSDKLAYAPGESYHHDSNKMGKW